MTPREQAIDDCNYAQSLGEIALIQHISIWKDGRLSLGHSFQGGDEEYYLAIIEIWDKLNTPECLLEK